MVATTIHLMRHGEVHNPDGVLYGRLPGYRLSERGLAMAHMVADHLAGGATSARRDIVAVIASPLQRAQETAAPAAAQHGLEIITDDRLIEADNSFEGKRVSVGDGALGRPQYWWRLRDPFTPSWGEPYLEIAERMLAAVHRARELASGHEALCVSHQLPIWTLRRYVTGRHLWHDPRRRQCALASLTSLVFDDGELVQLRYTEPAGRSDPTQTGA